MKALKGITKKATSVVGGGAKKEPTANEKLQKELEVPPLRSTTALLPHKLIKKGMVTIKAARNLLAADDNGLSDPYTMVCVNNEWKKTKVISKTLNPEWNYSFEHDMDVSTVLEFFVWDKDLLMSDFLGYATLDVSKAENHSAEGIWLKLGPRPKKAISNTEAGVGLVTGGDMEITSGEICVSFQWKRYDCGPEATSKEIKAAAKVGALEVTVVGASGLVPLSDDCKADSYAKVMLGKSHYRTAISHGFTNPEWNEHFVFPCKTKPNWLQVQIKNDNLVYGNTSFGLANILIKDLVCGEEQEFSAPLQDAKGGCVKVKVAYHSNGTAKQGGAIIGAYTAGKVASATKRKMAITTKGAAGTAFIRIPVRVLVKCCLILADRLRQKDYVGSVKGTIGFPALRFGWNAKTAESELKLKKLLNAVSINTDETEEDKKQETMLSKLVGLVVDRLLTIIRIMSLQMQEMNVCGALGVKVRVGYLGPPTPGTGGLPTPIKFSLGIKVNTDSVPHPKDGEKEPELDDNEKDVIVLPEQEAALAGDGQSGDKCGALKVTIIEAKGLIGVRTPKGDKAKEEKAPAADGDEEAANEKALVASPFVEVESGQHYHHTKFFKDTMTPAWNETFAFPVGDDGTPPPYVYLAVRDYPGDPPKGALAKIYSKCSQALTNQILGQARVPTASLTSAPKEEKDLWISLTKEAAEDAALDDGGPNGGLHLKMLFDPEAPSPPIPPPRETALKSLKQNTATMAAGVKEKGAIASMIRMAARMQVRAALILRKRCRERGFAGSICTYTKFGPAVTGFELETDDSEKDVEEKAKDAIPDINIKELDEAGGKFQSVMDSVVDFLLNGIAIGAHEMQRKKIKGNVWFGQFLPLGLVVDILVGLYINCDSVPPKNKLNVVDVDLEEKLCDRIEELEAEEEAKEAKAEGKAAPVKKPKKMVKGALKVTVVQAKELEAVDGDTSDPYACVKVGKDLLYTKIIEETITPEWKQEFVFPAATLPEFIDVKLYDDNVLYSDVKLGNVRISTADLQPGTPVDQWLPLVDAKSGLVRVVVKYEPDTEVAPIKYPSAWGRVKAGTGHKFKRTGRGAGKGTVRTGFKLAILSAILARNRIKERGYKGKGMTCVKAVLWQMAVSLSSSDSKAVEKDKSTKTHSRPVKVINACLDKLLDAIATGCEEIQRLNTQGTLKVKAAAMLGPPIANFFGITTGLAVSSESVMDSIAPHLRPKKKDKDKKKEKE